MVNKPSDFGRALRQGAFAWPGGYPLFFITSDSAALCFACAKREARQIMESIRHDIRDGWKIEAVDVNWEDAALHCEHCNKRIESAYAEDSASLPAVLAPGWDKEGA